MSNPTRTPVREIDGDIVAQRVQAARTRIRYARGRIELARTAAHRLQALDIETDLFAASGLLDDIAAELEPATVLAPVEAQEVAHG